MCFLLLEQGFSEHETNRTTYKLQVSHIMITSKFYKSRLWVVKLYYHPDGIAMWLELIVSARSTMPAMAAYIKRWVPAMIPY